ncbi:hypothetical protein CFC21_104892 [Triticum aestivum]|uniref:F-box associated beta-propeller type 3 domain-containing protein n=3 Tax=Triticum aestivum TaxID=4565 RepID=A0A3B6SMH1_WHEAT|nr:hypothetical protein CFC21_104892 [Triticum aestivum]
MSRSWAATLTSASFVELHLREANRHRSTPKLFFTTGHPEDPDNRWLIDKVLTKPCNGLVLLHRLPGSGYYVYNASTGVLLPLPDSDDRRWGMAMGESYGLGYSPITKEHKVVRLFNSGSTPCCEVFSLDVSMQWRVVPRQTPPSRVPVRVHPAVFCDGYLHFLQGRGGSNIVTFDVGDETFGLLATPPSAQGNDVPLELTVLGRRLCMCVFRGGRGSDVDPYCIWRLACRDSGQWEKLYRVLHPQTCRPQLDLLRVPWISPLETYLAGNVQKIMFATEVGVLAFDLQGGGGVPEVLVSPTEIVSAAEQAKISYSTAGLLEESLVPVGRTSEEIAFSSPWRKAWSDVLKWRPARSVASLAHVCKGWRAVIESDRFARTHALHANLGNKSPRLMLVLLRPFLNALDFYPLPLVFRRSMQQEIPSLHETSMSTVCSRPCHGLVLVTHMDGGSRVDFVCNPIRNYGCRVKTDPPNSPYSDGWIGLGYDLRRNEHVLARLVRPETETGSRHHQPMKCYVQLMGITPSPWIPISPPPRPPAVDMQPAYADGKLYWMVEDDGDDDKPASSRCELLALDVGTREFAVLPGPPCDRGQITSIAELQGNVCVVCSDTGANAIDVWTLGGAAGSWSAWPCRIELGEFRQLYPSAETRLLAVDPKDGRVLLSTGRVLGYYNPETRALQTAYCISSEDLQGMVAPAVCHESLLRPRI